MIWSWIVIQYLILRTSEPRNRFRKLSIFNYSPRCGKHTNNPRFEERSRELNRYFARKELCEKLEYKLFKEKSEKQKRSYKLKKQKKKRSKRAKMKMLEEKKKRSAKKELRKPPKLD